MHIKSQTTENQIRIKPRCKLDLRLFEQAEFLKYILLKRNEQVTIKLINKYLMSIWWTNRIHIFIFCIKKRFLKLILRKHVVIYLSSGYCFWVVAKLHIICWIAAGEPETLGFESRLHSAMSYLSLFPVSVPLFLAIHLSFSPSLLHCVVPVVWLAWFHFVEIQMLALLLVIN